MAQQPKAGSIVHVELHSREPEKIRDFYAKVFGWKFTEIPAMNYTTFQAPSPPHGGLMLPPENMPSGVLNYILSNEIDVTSRRIEEAGGVILVPKSEIPETGWFAIFRDPEGTVQALFQDMPRPSRRAAPRKKKLKKKARKTRKSTKGRTRSRRRR